MIHQSSTTSTNASDDKEGKDELQSGVTEEEVEDGPVWGLMDHVT